MEEEEEEEEDTMNKVWLGRRRRGRREGLFYADFIHSGYIHPSLTPPHFNLAGKGFKNQVELNSPEAPFFHAPLSLPSVPINAERDTFCLVGAGSRKMGQKEEEDEMGTSLFCPALRHVLLFSSTYYLL